MELQLTEALKALVGGKEPHPYQLRVGKQLLQGKNVVLRAPTGSGKTAAAIAPFLAARAGGVPFADRLIYALPLQTLASSLYNGFHGHLEKRGFRCTLQMGGHNNDPFFRGDVIFTTIDQILSGYLMLPVSLPPGQGNKVAGALIGAYIVIDEFHLLETQRSLATAVDLARRLEGLATLLLMSATVPDRVAEELSQRIKGIIELMPVDEVLGIPSQAQKIRRYHWCSHPMDPSEVWTRHLCGDGPTLVVRNTVRDAQSFYEELCCIREVAPFLERQNAGPVHLLHSRFLRQDRSRIEERLREAQGPHENRREIWVATQVVEVGLDVSFRRLFTDICPANSLVQRAGRCARFTGQEGDVFVHALAPGKSLAPYQDLEQEITLTKGRLTELSGQPVDYLTEIQLVQIAHEHHDLAGLSAIVPRAFRVKVEKAISVREYSALRELVRDVDAKSVIVCSQPPDSYDNFAHFEPLSIPTNVVRGFLRSTSGEVVKMADIEMEEGENAPTIKWKDVTDTSVGGAWLLWISTEAASYSPELGLQLGVPGAGIPETIEMNAKWQPVSYVKERIEVHVRNTVNALRSSDPNYQVTTVRLADLAGIRRETLLWWLVTISLLHDAGKLTNEWQDAIWRWQSVRSGASTPRERVFLAHSDFDGSNPIERELARKYPRPPHAVEGAFLVQPILWWVISKDLADSEVAREIMWAATAAIAHHHHPTASSIRSFRVSEEAIAVIDVELRRNTVPDVPSLQKLIRRQAKTGEGATFGQSFPTPAERLGWLFYCYMAHRLRLADTSSFDQKEVST